MKHLNAVGLLVFGVLLGMGLVMAETVPTLKKQQSAIVELQTALDAWSQQAPVTLAELKACRDDHSAVTVLVDPPDPVASVPSIPVPLGGATVYLSLGKMPGSSAGVWVIPRKVVPRTMMPGARYRWLDVKTGTQLGDFPAANNLAVIDQQQAAQ